MLKVVLHVSNEAYAFKLMAKGLFYILTNRIDQLAKEKNLTINEKVGIYDYLLREIEKHINKTPP